MTRSVSMNFTAIKSGSPVADSEAGSVSIESGVETGSTGIIAVGIGGSGVVLELHAVMSNSNNKDVNTDFIYFIWNSFLKVLFVYRHMLKKSNILSLRICSRLPRHLPGAFYEQGNIHYEDSNRR